jgi:hypothetical protein
MYRSECTRPSHKSPAIYIRVYSTPLSPEALDVAGLPFKPFHPVCIKAEISESALPLLDGFRSMPWRLSLCFMACAAIIPAIMPPKWQMWSTLPFMVDAE